MTAISAGLLMVTFSVATGKDVGMFVADLMHYTLSQTSHNYVYWNNYSFINLVCLVETVTKLQESPMKRGDNREPAGLLATLHKLM